MAPRGGVEALGNPSRKALLKQKKQLMERIEAEGSRFRTTEEERTQFRAAYLSQHVVDAGGAEASWDRHIRHLEGIKLADPELEGVEVEDLMALRAWTMTPDYMLVQDVLDGKKIPTAQGLAYAKSIISGLHSLPQSYAHTNQTVFTGEDQLAKWVDKRYTVGETTTSWRFFASSETKEAAWSGKGVEWETQALNGKRISKFSLHRAEEEVLFPPGTRFQVNDIVKQSSRPFFKIYQSEVDPEIS